jgi:hypothetical protein
MVLPRKERVGSLNASQHNQSGHIGSIDNRGHLHRKKIADRCADGFQLKRKIRFGRVEYGENDTLDRKLLQCVADNCQNVMFSAACLSSTPGS